MFSYQEAYRRYTACYTHTEIEKQKDGTFKNVTYFPQCPLNHRELDRLFAIASTWVSLLTYMREGVGCAGPVRSSADLYIRSGSVVVEPFVPDEPLMVQKGQAFEVVLLPNNRMKFVRPVRLSIV